MLGFSREALLSVVLYAVAIAVCFPPFLVTTVFVSSQTPHISQRTTLYPKPQGPCANAGGRLPSAVLGQSRVLSPSKATVNSPIRAPDPTQPRRGLPASRLWRVHKKRASKKFPGS